MNRLKLYRVANPAASYDELAQAIVWARSEIEALALVDLAIESGEEPGGWGPHALTGQYVATEVPQESGVVLGYTSWG